MLKFYRDGLVPKLELGSQATHFFREIFRRRSLAEFVLTFVICAGIHFYMFDSRFLKQDIVLGGDTQGLWSFFYWHIYSLFNFHEFGWWDPTSYNGWPSYFYALSGFVSYLSPYSLPALAFGLLGHLFGMSVNTFLVLHKTVISYWLNLLAIMLISRELIRHPLARFLPALLFTLSEISFHGFRDAVLYESMPPALFYLFGLVQFNNRRTAPAFLLFIFLTGAFIASFNYAFLQSSLYWTSAFTLLIVLFFPSILKETWAVVLQIAETRRGQILLGLGILYCVSAFIAFFTPVALNLGHVIRVSGAGPISYDVSLAGDYGPGAIAAWPAWTSFLMWSPLPELHDKVLTFDPWGAGIDHRYIGMVTLPLLAVALLRPRDVRYVLVVFLTFAICALFVVYTVQNLALEPIIERFPVLQNIRTMSNTMPREGPSIMIMLLAGMGMDSLIRNWPFWNTPINSLSIRSVIHLAVVAAMLLNFVVLGLGFGLFGASSIGSSIRGALTHMAIYLTASAVLCLALLLHPGSRAKLWCISVALLIVTFMDLTLSASAYWERGKVWYANQSMHRYPTPSGIGPTADPNWPGTYRGIIHNLWGGPWYGLKTWLVLVYRPAWQPVLANWDPQSMMVTAYPSFQFFSNGKFVPFETIRKIDEMPVPAPPQGFELSADETYIESIDGPSIPILPGPAGYVEQVMADPTTVRFTGWAIDETAGTVPRKILAFAGGRLWADGSRPYVARTDILALGANYRNAGFNFVAKGLATDQRVGIRLFALLADGTARELRYSAGFPFPHAGAPADNSLPSLESIKRNARTLNSFYIHDESAVLHNSGDGARVKDVSTTVLHFSPNIVRVRVNVPSDVFMVSNDNYDRFWSATIDGSEVPVYRANYTYKAIRVPLGEHIVEWRYNPWPVKAAWAWFYVVLATFSATWVGWWRSNLRKIRTTERSSVDRRTQKNFCKALRIV